MRLNSRNRHFELPVEKYDAAMGQASEIVIMQEYEKIDFDAIKTNRVHSLISEKIFNSITI